VLHVARRNEIPAGETAIARATAIAEGIAFAKDLGNLPGNHCTPTYLAEQAVEMGKRQGIKVEVLEQKDIEKLGMGCFLAVARGSRQPPKLIVMEYHGGKRDAAPVALVGKGITVRHRRHLAQARRRDGRDEVRHVRRGERAGRDEGDRDDAPAAERRGRDPRTENMPGGNAIKPATSSPPCRARPVEILNTDAEGRLVLCDALTYVEKYKPAAVVDIATLTGAMVIALGHVATGLFANSDALARELIAAGETSWDAPGTCRSGTTTRTRSSPTSPTCRTSARAPAAPSRRRASCRATPRAYPWAHLDIAGTAWKSGAEKGATGRRWRCSPHFLAKRAS
jgi:leucyl aminopeptidase